MEYKGLHFHIIWIQPLGANSPRADPLESAKTKSKAPCRPFMIVCGFKFQEPNPETHLEPDNIYSFDYDKSFN